MITLFPTHLPPLELQKNLCLVSTRPWHGKTWKPPKISEIIFGFSQINISSEATEAVRKANFCFYHHNFQVIPLHCKSDRAFTFQLSLSPFYQQKTPQATEKLLHSYQTGRELLFHWSQWDDFPKLEVHLLNRKPNLGECLKRGAQGKKKSISFMTV